MNVEQLIEELQKIKNKKKKVYFDDEEWGIQLVNEVTIYEYDSDEPILLKN